VPLDGLSDAENVLIRDGKFIVRPGVTAYGDDINERPLGYIQYFNNAGTVITVMGTDLGWHKLDSATDTWTDITEALNPLTGGALDPHIFRIFQKAGATWLLGTNGADAPKKWDSVAATYVDMGGSPPRARCMEMTFERLILGNLLSGGTISPVAVDVSAFQDFDSGWGATQTALLADTPGEIMSMNNLGLFQTAIYKKDAIYLAIAQGATDPFRFELKVAPVAGPASYRSVVPLPDGTQIYLAEDGDIKLFDGISVRSYLGRGAQDFITGSMNVSTIRRAFGFLDTERGEAVFMYPEQTETEASVGIVINLRTRAFWPLRWSALEFSAGIKLALDTGATIGELSGTIGGLAATIGEFASSTPRRFLGQIGGQTYQDTGDDDAGTAIPFHAESGLFNLGSSLRRKTVHEVHYRFVQTAAAQNIDARLGYSDHGEARTLETAQTLALNTAGPYKSSHRRTARLVSQRLEGSASQPIQIREINVIASLRGVR
jgi:hypothetical protein